MRRAGSRGALLLLVVALVALLLGLLVVGQLRTRSAGNGLETLSVQELTTLVGNLNARNDELRGEVAALTLDNRRVTGVQLRDGRTLASEAVIITSGTFLNGLAHIGEQFFVGKNSRLRFLARRHNNHESHRLLPCRL